MVCLEIKKFVFIFVTAHIVLANLTNNPIANDKTTVEYKVGKIKDVIKSGNFRRSEKIKKHRSTSSSSGEAWKSDEKGTGSSLGMSTEGSNSSETSDSGVKKSSDQVGWRKWHRKCPSCPESNLSWVDHRVFWICGAYQRARRTFKSACMMRYRNCQDGTMFVKIHDHKCKNDTSNRTAELHGDHFFYDYKAHGIFMSKDSLSSSPSSDSSSSASDDPKKWDTIEYLYT